MTDDTVQITLSREDYDDLVGTFISVTAQACGHCRCQTGGVPADLYSMHIGGSVWANWKRRRTPDPVWDPSQPCEYEPIAEPCPSCGLSVCRGSIGEECTHQAARPPRGED